MHETSSRDWRCLLVQLGLGCPCTQMPAAAALVVALVLDGNFAEMTENVLHLGVGSGTALTAEVVEPFNTVHQEVDNGNDNLEADNQRPVDIRIEAAGLTMTPME